VQEEELDSCCAAGERGPEAGGMWVQGETKAGSPCAIFEAGKKRKAAGSPALGEMVSRPLS
jgi:hypothetical protein